MKKSILITLVCLQTLILIIVSTTVYFTYVNKISILANQNVLIHTQKRLSSTFTFMDNMTGKKPYKENIETSSLTKGSEAPTFLLLDENNQEIKLENYKGKKTLLVFSQEGCGYCENFYPSLNALQTQSNDVNIIVMQINSSPEYNKIYKQQQGIEPTILAATVNDFKNYRVEVTPTTVLVDEKGKIITSSKNTMNLNELLNFIKQS